MVEGGSGQVGDSFWATAVICALSPPPKERRHSEPRRVNQDNFWVCTWEGRA